MQAAAASQLEPESAGQGGEQRYNTLIVFTSTCMQCQLYHEICVHLGIPSAPLHSQLSQGRRLAGLAKFREGAACILVATDVASRGLDIPTVDLVLNLDVPRESVNYVHRVGRAARAGRSGRAVTFVTPNEIALVKAVERLTKVTMQVVEADDDAVALVLHKASTAKRAAALQMVDDKFEEREELAKTRKLARARASGS
jgi:superfamily II DNA/RNA helicase